MEDLLGALMQGGQQQSEPEGEGPEDDPLAQLLQGLMGDQAPQDFAARAIHAGGEFCGSVRAQVVFGSELTGLRSVEYIGTPGFQIRGPSGGLGGVDNLASLMGLFV